MAGNSQGQTTMGQRSRQRQSGKAVTVIQAHMARPNHTAASTARAIFLDEVTLGRLGTTMTFQPLSRSLVLRMDKGQME